MERKYSMRVFVIGDIHGAALALLQCIERSGADIDKDLFIVLGDVTDGWPEVPEAIEILLKIKNLIYITGNHDIWSRAFLKKNFNILSRIEGHYDLWYTQGGQATVEGYERRPELLDLHLEFLNNSKPYHILDNKLFIHGGYDFNQNIEEQTEFDIAWNRKFWETVRSGKGMKNIIYDEVFIGHSPTINYPKNDGSHTKPMNYGKVWNLDTGATYTGKLSIMDVDSKEIWQSDVVQTLYPNHRGRN